MSFLKCYCFIFIFFITEFCFAVTPKPLSEIEQDKLFKAYKENTNRINTSIDITFSKKTIFFSKLVKLKENLRQEKKRQLEEKLPESNLVFKSHGARTPENNEIFLFDSHIQINDITKYREDVTLFKDSQKKNEVYDETHMKNADISLKIDNTKKLVFYDQKYNWGAGRETLRYGTFLADYEISRDIVNLCRHNTSVASDKKVTKIFRYKGEINENLNKIIVVELFDITKQKTNYELFLDSNDWGKCYKIVWYNDEGTCMKKNVEYKNFLEINNKHTYPYNIEITLFDEECKEIEKHIINVKDVSIGIAIDDNVFDVNEKKFDDNYTIIDRQKK